MAFPMRGTGIPVLLILTLGVVEAQPVARSASAAVSSPAAASSLGQSSTYRSAFEGYRSFAEQPLAPWREANDVVKSVGGWQAYAREGQGDPPAGVDDTAAMPAGHAGMDMRPSVNAPSAPSPRPAADAASAVRPTRRAEQKKP